MKYLKIFACLLGSAAVASCGSDSEKPEYNSNSGVTVSMETDFIQFKENRGLVSIPMVVSGETNGYVTVECEVKEYGSVVAMEDVHYLLTSKTYTFDTGATTGAFELKLVDDFEENEPREFVITLISAQGATIGTPNTTIVAIKDNDSDPYDKLGGTWYAQAADGARQIELVTADDNEPAYGVSLTMTGLLGTLSGNPEPVIKVDFLFDEDANKGTLTINYGQELGEFDLSAYGYGTGDSYLGYFVGSESFDLEGAAVFTWNEEMTEITLVSDPNDEGAANFVNFVHVSAGWLYIDAAEGVTKITRTK